MLSSRWARLVFGLLSVLPLAILLWGVVYSASSDPSTFGPYLFAALAGSAVLALTFVLLMRRPSQAPWEIKALWWILLFTAPPIAVPMFWYACLRKG